MGRRGTSEQEVGAPLSFLSVGAPPRDSPCTGNRCKTRHRASQSASVSTLLRGLDGSPRRKPQIGDVLGTALRYNSAGPWERHGDSRLMLVRVLAAVLMLLVPTAVGAQTEKRIALLIGNQSYNAKIG